MDKTAQRAKPRNGQIRAMGKAAKWIKPLNPHN
jgi:hypothetical protein